MQWRGQGRTVTGRKSDADNFRLQVRNARCSRTLSGAEWNHRWGDRGDARWEANSMATGHNRNALRPEGVLGGKSGRPMKSIV